MTSPLVRLHSDQNAGWSVVVRKCPWQNRLPGTIVRQRLDLTGHQVVDTNKMSAMKSAKGPERQARKDEDDGRDIEWAGSN